ncbi:TonB-dependent receptor [uncultured Brevundimonas sp.]|uniref:TonB-dependent receptor n=1 Tax=uncultured Brevundimonas sp. TaxID=213418 RepID=UPI00262995B4|nr:TonB-dependent receptor [uncultured Brevundimonas sp.]
MKKSSANRRGLAFGVSAAAMLAALSFGGTAYAQVTGSIQGRTQGAVGEAVIFTDTVTGQRSRATIGADGRYVITGLRPSTYTVQVGSEAPETVTLAVGETVTVDFVSGTLEDVIAIGARPREVRTATVSTNVTPLQLEVLPTVSRNFLDGAALAPGVTVTNDFTTNNKRLQAGGVSSQNINVFVDGVSNKDQVGGNGVAGQSFSQGNPFPQSAIQEFQVQTQNFKAEYEQAGSAIISAVTRTGGDEFHGAAYATYIPQAWFGQPFFDRANPKPDFERSQYGVNVGGPIIRGVLHFFADYEATRSQYPGATINLTDPRVPASYLAENGTALGNFELDNYFAKLTWFASDDDTVNLSYFSRQETDIRDFGNVEVSSHARNVATQSETITADWSHRGDNWLNEVSLSRFTNETGTPTVTSGPEFNLQRTDGANILVAGAHFFTQANTNEHTTFKETFTYTGVQDHVIKAGFRYNRAVLGREENNAANGRYFFDAYDNDNDGWTPFTDFDTSIPTRAIISTRTPDPITATDNQYGFFIQDDWTVDDHWTINYGLRWDYEDNAFNNDYVTPALIATALRGYTNWQAAGIDPEDYITDGSRRDPFTGAFQPRIGVSYDVNGDRSTVLFAGAGRYYDRNIFYTAALETIINAQQIPTINFCNGPMEGQGLPACDPLNDSHLQWNEAYRDADALRAAISPDIRGDIWVINNDAKVPYTDQFNIGIRQRFGDWQTAATIAHNRSYDAFIYVRGNRQANGNYTDAGDAFVRDNFPASDRPAGYTGRVNIGSSEGEYKYTALYLTADKPYSEDSGWGVTGTLTVSEARSNQGRDFGAAEMFNAGRQDAFGWQDVAGLEKWRFVSTGIVDLPWDFQLSGVLTLSSGPGFGEVDFTEPAGAPGCGCFTFNEAGVHQPDGINFQNLDLRLSKTFRPWGGQEIKIDAEIFNVFDSVNRNYSTWGAGCCGPTRPLIENGTIGYARTYQIGLRYKW